MWRAQDPVAPLVNIIALIVGLLSQSIRLLVVQWRGQSEALENTEDAE
jgi:hypothetical protein